MRFLNRNIILKSILPLFIIFSWELVYRLEVVDPALLPSAIGTLKRTFTLFSQFRFGADFLSSLYRMFVGFGLATVVGVFLGLLMGSYKVVYSVMLPIIDFIRSIPVTALYPIFVLIVGIQDSSKIAMIFTGCVFIIAINTAYGVFQSNEIRKNTARLYGASNIQVFFWIRLYESLPQTVVGLRISLSLALIVVILTEMFMGADLGIGQRLTESFTTYNVEEMFAIILLTGLIGYLLNYFFMQIEARVLPWVAK